MVTIYSCDFCGKEHREMRLAAAVYPAYMATSSYHTERKHFCSADCLCDWIQKREAEKWCIA